LFSLFIFISFQFHIAADIFMPLLIADAIAFLSHFRLIAFAILITLRLPLIDFHYASFLRFRLSPRYAAAATGDFHASATLIDISRRHYFSLSLLFLSLRYYYCAFHIFMPRQRHADAAMSAAPGQRATPPLPLIDCLLLFFDIFAIIDAWLIFHFRIFPIFSRRFLRHCRLRFHAHLPFFDYSWLPPYYAIFRCDMFPTHFRRRFFIRHIFLSLFLVSSSFSLPIHYGWLRYCRLIRHSCRHFRLMTLPLRRRYASRRCYADTFSPLPPADTPLMPFSPPAIS
jgi:hypothetical protein